MRLDPRINCLASYRRNYNTNPKRPRELQPQYSSQLTGVNSQAAQMAWPLPFATKASSLERGDLLLLPLQLVFYRPPQINVLLGKVRTSFWSTTELPPTNQSSQLSQREELAWILCLIDYLCRFNYFPMANVLKVVSWARGLHTWVVVLQLSSKRLELWSQFKAWWYLGGLILWASAYEY